MKIKYVEEQVGITKKNIRFYEEQGLLSPGRADNGYREYGEEDLKRLKQIKFLRKLYVPIEEIKAVSSGDLSLDVCLQRQLYEFEQKKNNLEELQKFTNELLTSSSGITLDELDVDLCLDKISAMEREGHMFMDVNVTDIHRKKTMGSVIGAAAMILLLFIFGTLIWWGNMEDPLPIPVFVIFIGIPVVIGIFVLVVLIQRIREIRGGEEDEASKY